MGLLDPRSLQILGGLLADTPIGRFAQGKDKGPTVEGLKQGLLNIKPFQGISEAEFNNATGGISPMGVIGTVAKLPYQGPHRPLTVEGGAARLHDLTPSFGPDIYGPKALQYFGGFDPRESAVLKIMQKVKGNPEAEVTIYRGIPEGKPQSISPGDWVTLHPSVASDYGKVVSQKVKAKDLTSWADSLLEFGYYP